MSINYGLNDISTSGNINVSGVITATSGNFTNLLINGNSFNSSVSGLLPTIANSGDNRILTSTGSSTGINAEANLTFDGTNLGVGTSSPSGMLDVRGNLIFDTFTERVIDNGNSGTSKTLSIASGTVHKCTLTGNCTFTMPSLTAGKSFTLFLNTGAGSYTATFTSVLWNDSVAPTVTTTSSKTDIFNFISDGSYWYGSYSQNYG